MIQKLGRYFWNNTLYTRAHFLKSPRDRLFLRDLFQYLNEFTLMQPSKDCNEKFEYFSIFQIVARLARWEIVLVLLKLRLRFLAEMEKFLCHIKI